MFTATAGRAPRGARPDRGTVLLTAAGVLLLPVITIVAASLRPSWTMLVLVLAGFAGAALVVLLPQAAVPAAWVLVVFIGLVRRLVAGPSAHVDNDPLIAAPYVVLVPLLVARLWWRSRYRIHLWLALGFAVLVSVSFLVVVIHGDADFGVLRAAVTNATAPLCALALTHPALRGSLRATFATVRYTAVAAAAYGIVQYVAPPRWDLQWLQSVVSSGVQTFGQPAPGQFRLFGPMSAPLAFALVLSVGIACWAFSREPLWVRLPAIVVMTIPLLLTSVRTSVFALVIALPVAVALHYRQRAVVPLVAIIAAVGAIPAVLELIAPDLVTRFSTTSLSTDTSYNARLRLLDSVSAGQFGLGGGPGASVRGSIGTDNGYLAAFIDYGILGGVLLIGIVLAALVVAVRYAVSVQGLGRGLPLVIVLLYALSEASAPVLQGQQGLVFWVVLGLLGAETIRGRRAEQEGGPDFVRLDERLDEHVDERAGLPVPHH